MKRLNIKIDIPFFYPNKLKEMAKNLKSSDKFPDIKSSFEYPPKSMEKVFELLQKDEFDKINFFDIARFLSRLQKNELPLVFEVSLLEKLYQAKEKYIQFLIIKTISKILLDKENNLRKSILNNSKQSEFRFVGFCVKQEFEKVSNAIKNNSLKRIFKFYGIEKIFKHIIFEYSNYVLKQFQKENSLKEKFELYKNNLLLEDDLILLYKQLEKLINLIQTKHKNSFYFEKLIGEKLGDINDENSNWYNFSIPEHLIDEYKRLKGFFEFQTFVRVAEYLAKNSDLKYSNVSKSGTSDANRLLNRSLFWSNYDEVFSSVTMWISKEDYEILEEVELDINLSKINVLEFDNEASLFEFRDSKLLILIFFRTLSNDMKFYSLVFENKKVEEIKEMLENYTFDINLYKILEDKKDYIINERVFLWTGWVDKFLREKNIYPNSLIKNGTKKFVITPNIKETYGLQGLSQTREKAVNSYYSIYDDVIKCYN